MTKPEARRNAAREASEAGLSNPNQIRMTKSENAPTENKRAMVTSRIDLRKSA